MRHARLPSSKRSYLNSGYLLHNGITVRKLEVSDPTIGFLSIFRIINAITVDVSCLRLIEELDGLVDMKFIGMFSRQVFNGLQWRLFVNDCIKNVLCRTVDTASHAFTAFYEVFTISIKVNIVFLLRVNWIRYGVSMY